MAYLGHFDPTTIHGRLLRSMIDQNESADTQFKRVREMLIQMRSGDGSQDAHYTDVVKFLKYGGYAPVQGDPSSEQLQLARASFEELDSAYSKTSGDGSVSNVRAARDQFFAKHRG